MKITAFNGKINTTEKKNREIKYIVIHYTAGITSKVGSALSTAKYFAKNTTKASADFIVDDETIVQYSDDIRNRYCWHCGGSKLKTKGGSLYGKCTNANSIGIEMCSKNLANKVTDPNDTNWDITVGTFNCTVELVANLCKEYNIPIENIIRHYDVTGKLCPGVIGWNEDSGDVKEWMEFKKEVEEKLKKLSTTTDDYVKSLEQQVKDLTLERNDLKSKLERIQGIIRE